MDSTQMDYATKCTALACRSLHLLDFSVENHHAITCSNDDETLKSVIWIGANYHKPVELPDTTGLDWMEAVIRCLESIYPRVSSFCFETTLWTVIYLFVLNHHCFKTRHWDFLVDLLGIGIPFLITSSLPRHLHL